MGASAISSAGHGFRQIMGLRMRLIYSCTKTARYDLCTLPNGRSSILIYWVAVAGRGLPTTERIPAVRCPLHTRVEVLFGREPLGEGEGVRGWCARLEGDRKTLRCIVIASAKPYGDVLTQDTGKDGRLYKQTLESAL